MIINSVSSASAFSSGSKLWALSQPQVSYWSRRCDWYLNYQLISALRRKSFEVDQRAAQLFSDAGYQLPPFKTSTRATQILVSPHQRLPANQVILVPLEQEIQPWFEQILRVWQGLDRPSLRIFLPETVTSNECEDFFRPLSEVVEIGFVSGYLS